MPTLLKNKPLLIVSAFIILSDLLFIAINYYSALNAVNADTRRWAKEAQHVFALSMEAKATSMQQLASFVANIPQVQKLFHQAQLVNDQPDSAAREAELSDIRSRLHAFVEPSWQQMTSQYDVRQLHFHFGPGSTSFLRVHRPEKHGDNMDEVRYTVVDVNRLHRPVKGFETGRVYSGIRGVVPVSMPDKDGRATHVGALEAGTSFTVMLKALAAELDSNIAVLLHEKHIRQNMWPEFVKKHFGENRTVDDYYVECSTAPTPRDFLSQSPVTTLLNSGHGAEFLAGDTPIQVGVFPLRDYRGTIDFNLPDSGAVVIWKDATEKWDLLRKSLFNNILYSLVALFFVEAALVVGWRLSQRHLRTIIRRQTRKLRELATHDALTGIYNRRAIERILIEETHRARRHGSPFAVLMFDIDHFKRVNDTFGHNAGDEVLRKVSETVTSLVRTTDRFGRWGGEEFLLLATDTDIEAAAVLAERIREAVAETRFTTAEPVTISLGVARYQPDETYENLVQRADTALYKAKDSGRDRVCVAD
ncbi:sensor domain-containing diguanylate cyclase [Salidesulfovibrio onnuriiensis]|uniref:sensor domain-containing diguanylate cyclase n=1 Tax=Salidesulfovibrio onnuriiensis TaxID=2583823 RepID=UPI00164FADC6|nr:diguanylate cyclase [Salidesulfovibrio onnuriiensis]